MLPALVALARVSTACAVTLLARHLLRRLPLRRFSPRALMGCFQSTAEKSPAVTSSDAATTPFPAAAADCAAADDAAAAAAAAALNAPVLQQQQQQQRHGTALPDAVHARKVAVRTPVSGLPAEPEADPSGQVLSVPRAAVTIGDRERATLKVKNLRDKLETTISLSETLLRDEALLALQYRRKGNEDSARILMRRRVHTRAKIRNADVMLSSVMDMIDGMEQAQDNKRLVEALEQGTRAINDVSRDVTAERMQEALTDNREATEYVNNIASLVAAEAAGMSDADFETEMAHLEEELEGDTEAPPAQLAAHVAADATAGIPDVPTDKPSLADVSTTTQKQQHQKPTGTFSPTPV